MREDLWIASVHVKSGAQNSALSEGAKGAYANAIGLAEDVHQFEEHVKKAVQELGLKLIEFEDAEKFDELIQHADVSKELWDLAESMGDSDQIHFDAFYNYSADEEIQ